MILNVERQGGAGQGEAGLEREGSGEGAQPQRPGPIWSRANTNQSRAISLPAPSSARRPLSGVRACSWPLDTRIMGKLVVPTLLGAALALIVAFG